MHHLFAQTYQDFFPLISTPNHFVLAEVQSMLPKFTSSFITSLCQTAALVFSQENILLNVYKEVIIVGDLHGQIMDLFRILQNFGLPPKKSYLFLGDLVDRGEFSTEIVILIFLLKILFPDNIFVIRGNHEFQSMWDGGGFASEIINIYKDPGLRDSFANAFSYMPLAAIVNNTALAVHGGIGPSFTKLSQISSLMRPIDTCEGSDLLLALLWSDPSDIVADYLPSPRGVGYFYGDQVLSTFLDQNKLTLLIRGHECVRKGVRPQFDGRLVTVFSASNYCGVSDNFAGVLIHSPNGNCEILTFDPFPALRRLAIPSSPVKESSYKSRHVPKNDGNLFEKTEISKIGTQSVNARPRRTGIGASNSYGEFPTLAQMGIDSFSSNESSKLYLDNEMSKSESMFLLSDSALSKKSSYSISKSKTPNSPPVKRSRKNSIKALADRINGNLASSPF